MFTFLIRAPCNGGMTHTHAIQIREWRFIAGARYARHPQNAPTNMDWTSQCIRVVFWQYFQRAA